MALQQIIINHHICIAIVLSVILMTHGTCGRQDLSAYITRQELPLAFLDELLAGANEDAFYSELKKHHSSQPHYNSKWPGLRDLLLTADYDDTLDNNENVNSRFIERLRQLAASSVDMEEEEREGNELEVANMMLPTPMPLKKLTPLPMTSAKVTFKDQSTKKNLQYMSPCHFKICNMGRKRNARYFKDY